MAKVALRGLKGRLVNSSVDAYVLALETINSLSVRYRIEGFTFLILNAWELLLKAHLIDLEGSPDAVFVSAARRGERRRSLRFEDCLHRIYQKENDPVRLNLEFVNEERNKATHLVLDRIPAGVLAVYQACVINYHDALSEWFGISLSDRVPVGMMSIVFDLSPDNFDLTNKALRRRLGSEAVIYLMERQKEIDHLQERARHTKQFAAEIQHKVSVAKADKGEIQLVAGATGREIGVMDKLRDPAVTHPFRRKEAIAEINRRLEGRSLVNTHDVTCVNHCNKIQASNSELFYRSHIPGAPSQYSQAYIDWLVARFESDPKFFDKCRTRYKRWRGTNKLPNAPSLVG